MTFKTILLDGAAGVTMTTANSGAASVNGIAAGFNTAVFSSAAALHGPTGGEWKAVGSAAGGNAAGSFSRFNFDNGTTDIAQTFGFVVPPSKPSANMPFCTFRATGARSVQLQYSTAGVLQFMDKANVVTDVATAAQLPAGAKVTIAWRVSGASTTAGTAVIEVRDFLAGTVIATKTVTTANVTVDPFVAGDIGVIGSMIGNVLVDDIQTDTGRTTLIPPYSPPANTAPVVDAGLDQDVAPGAVVTLKGTATDAESSVATQAWTCVATPPGVAAPTITGANNLTATVALPAGVTGRFRFELRATDDAGAVSNPDAVNVYVRGTSTRPTYDVSNSGPWSGAVGVLADADDATYTDSPEGTSVEAVRRVGLGPLKPPATFALTVRSLLTADAPTGVAAVRLYEGAALRKTWTATPGLSLGSQVFTLSSAEIATVTDWLSLQLELSWKVV